MSKVYALYDASKQIRFEIFFQICPKMYSQKFCVRECVYKLDDVRMCVCVGNLTQTIYTVAG